MNNSEILFRYFPSLSPKQIHQFSQLKDLYGEWNEKINVISRKDIDNLYVNHVLHSLAIARVITFKAGTKVLDVGTGGGFPGIPLAILFPESHFHLVDATGKKIKVVNEIAKALNLENVTATQARVEELAKLFPETKQGFDFVVSRGVSSLSELFRWTFPLIRKTGFNSLRNGMLFLKGGNLDDEIKELKRKVMVFDISNYFEEAFFESKKVVYIA